MSRARSYVFPTIHLSSRMSASKSGISIGQEFLKHCEAYFFFASNQMQEDEGQERLRGKMEDRKWEKKQGHVREQDLHKFSTSK